MDDAQLRTHVQRLLDWHDAHASFDDAVSGIPADLRGRQPQGLPYSPWQLLEHLRLAQQDILEFCVNPDYEEKTWPEGYWPGSAAPTGDGWERSVESFRTDREALKELASRADLFAAIPRGTGQTVLRELLLVADHNAYHIGELVVVRRLLGIWR
jgi:hypothetical protein